MYFWNIAALREELKAEKISEQEKVKYLVATMAVYTVLVYLSSFFPESPSTLGVFELLSITGLTFWGIYWCFQANQKGDGQNFVERYICLGWPIGLRVMVYFMALYLIYLTIGFVFGGSRFDAFIEKRNLVGAAVVLISELVYYFWVRQEILKISK